MEIHKNKVGILTSSGEFIYVANSTVSPNLGEIYESEEIKLRSSAYKNIKKVFSYGSFFAHYFYMFYIYKDL